MTAAGGGGGAGGTGGGAGSTPADGQPEIESSPIIDPNDDSGFPVLTDGSTDHPIPDFFQEGPGLDPPLDGFGGPILPAALEDPIASIPPGFDPVVNEGPASPDDLIPEAPGGGWIPEAPGGGWIPEAPGGGWIPEAPGRDGDLPPTDPPTGPVGPPDWSGHPTPVPPQDEWGQGPGSPVEGQLDDVFLTSAAVTSVTPEPSSLALALIGAMSCGTVAARRRRRLSRDRRAPQPDRCD